MASRSTYDEALGERILDLVADGATLSAASAVCGVPRQTVRSWLSAMPAFAVAFDAACKVRYEVLAEQIEARANEALDVAKRAATDGVNENAAIAALRVELENKRWLLSKLAPKQYGDKVQQEVTGKDGTPLIPATADPSTEEGRGERQKLALALLNIIRGDDPGRFSEPLPIPAAPLQPVIDHEPVESMSPRDYREAERRRLMFRQGVYLTEAEANSIEKTY